MGAVYFMKVEVPPLDSALPMGNRYKLTFKVFGAVYFMNVAVSPLDSTLPMGQPLNTYFKKS